MSRRSTSRAFPSRAPGSCRAPVMYSRPRTAFFGRPTSSGSSAGLAMPIVTQTMISFCTFWRLFQPKSFGPTFAEMFAGSGKKLPALTQALVDISDFTKAWWYVIVPALVAAVWLFLKWKRTERGHYAFDEFMLKMPVFGQLNLKSFVGRFARLLAQMLGAGVPILKSLDVVARALGNRVLEKSVTLARQEVEQGNQLNTALTGKPYMPLILIRMIAAGEKSGRVEDMLNSVADAYDEEVETLLSTLTVAPCRSRPTPLPPTTPR